MKTDELVYAPLLMVVAVPDKNGDYYLKKHKVKNGVFKMIKRSGNIIYYDVETRKYYKGNSSIESRDMYVDETKRIPFSHYYLEIINNDTEYKPNVSRKEIVKGLRNCRKNNEQ